MKALTLRTVRIVAHALVIAAFVGLMAVPRPARALDLCVETLADLVDGLHAALTPQADGTVTLRLVAQTYAWNGSELVVLANRLNLLGGYAPGCGARTVDPSNTVIDGLGGLDLEWYELGLGVTIEGITFQNAATLRLNGALECADYGNAVTWRRTIVSGGAGDLRVGSSCGPLLFQNNLLRLPLGAVIEQTPKQLALDVYIVNNTFMTTSDGIGLRLLRHDEDDTSSKFYVSNNIMWGSSGSDFDFATWVDLPEVIAWNNIWGISLVPLVGGGGNLSVDPQLDANGIPAAPGSPAINSGHNSPPGGLPAVDIIGNPRLVGSAVDRGAFESAVVDTTELVVTHAGDSGPGSLRQAILDANSLPNFNTIRFAIPGDFGAILLPQSPYPDIVTPMRIDGFTQPGAEPNDSSWSNNATYRITIAGGGVVSYAFRVPVNAPSTASLDLRGFMIGGFTNAVLLQSGSGHRVRGNHFGRFSDDLLGGSDNHNSIYVNSTADDVDIGGVDPAERNSIAGHPEPVAGAGHGIYLGGSGQGHLVAGNLVGTFPNGNEAHGNLVGIRVDSDLGIVMSNLVSGNGTGIVLNGNDNIVASNRIGVKAFTFCLPPCVPDYALPNIHGIHVMSDAEGNDLNQNQVAYNDYSGLILFAGTLGNTLSANRVHSNDVFDLDLREPAGMNPIDGDGILLGGCDEANCDQNFPQLDAAFGVRHAGRVQGSLSTSNGEYRIEFFSGSTCGNGGQGGASAYLGAREVTVTGGSTLPPMNGSAVFDWPLSSTGSLYGRYITATATSTGGNTSEYSACVAYACDQIFGHGFDDAHAQTCPAP